MKVLRSTNSSWPYVQISRYVDENDIVNLEVLKLEKMQFKEEDIIYWALSKEVESQMKVTQIEKMSIAENRFLRYVDGEETIRMRSFELKKKEV